MSLEAAFKRLAIQSKSSICHQCRRTFASAISRRAQSATGGLAESLTSPRQPQAQAVVPPTSVNAALNTSQPAPARTSYDIASELIQESSGAQKATEERRLRERGSALTREWSRADLERQQPRRWAQGDVYAPHDLSGAEAAKWKKLRRKTRSTYDVCDQLGINPIQHYKNFSMMSEYMSDMGRIKHRRETGLRPVNQRRMAKAIRRAVGTGLMPGVHRHPEILRLEWQRNHRRA